ncbi:MAG: rod shape-determining protein RodA [Methylococcaceae bacterium]|nr:MAG: rod shape-determining protein RodA [Methylococcaceae bacterium]
MKFDPRHNYLHLNRQQRPPLLRRLHLDFLLLAGLGFLACIAFLILFSAGGQSSELLVRQMVRLLIAGGVMCAIAQIPPRLLNRYSPAFYIGTVVLLLAVLVMGEIGKGAQRWLDLGILRFQPSEFAKIATPMMVAWYLAEHPLPPSWKRLAMAGGLILLPTLMIAKQPDLGTALLVAAAGAAVVFFAGLSWRIMLGMAGAIGALLPAIWYNLHGYQRDRIRTFLDPEADPLGKGYHIIQSKIAIGSGGIFGKGWLNGTQARLDFLPESSTDFIFAVLAEEFGLFGCLSLLAVYLLIITRCLFIVLEAQNTYSRLLSGSLTLTFFVYVFVNIGMVIGVLPVVGVPLPLISYGGTSMVTLLAGFGILMSILTHNKRLLAGGSL